MGLAQLKDQIERLRRSLVLEKGRRPQAPSAAARAHEEARPRGSRPRVLAAPPLGDGYQDQLLLWGLNRDCAFANNPGEVASKRGSVCDSHQW